MNLQRHFGPGGVLAWEVLDRLDGTGTRTTYAADGTVASTEELSGLPIPDPPEPTAEERIAQLEAIIAALLGGAP
jgi:hypothetical protein